MRGSLKLKGKIYKACLQGVLLYDRETWAIKVENMNKLERAERSMMRMMCDVSLKDRKSSRLIVSWLGIDPVSVLVRRGRLRWFGHVERKDKKDWVSACRDMKVDGTKDRGRGRKTWMECIVSDMKSFGLRREDAQNREIWKDRIAGNRLSAHVQTQPHRR